MDINAIDRSETEITSRKGKVGGQAVTVPDVQCKGRGDVRGFLRDVVRMIASHEIRREPSWSRRVWLIARFVGFFVGHVVQARVPFLQRTQRIDPLHRPPLDEGRAPNKTLFERPVQPRFRLTRYDPPESVQDPRHVIVAPGFGMSTDAFLIGQPDSLVSFLNKSGFVVWLLDYRGSDQLDASLTQFDLDDLVDDFKSAIELVHRKAGKKVHVLAHCVASLVTSMLLLRDGASIAGKLESVVLSQSMAFIDHPFPNRLLAWLRLPQILRVLGFNPILTTDLDPMSSWRARLMDKALRFYPTVEHCSSGVCRRTLFMYGEVVHHQRLDRHTHDMMYDMFDRANLAALAFFPDPASGFRGPQSIVSIEDYRDGDFRRTRSAFRMTIGNDGWGRAGSPATVIKDLLENENKWGSALPEAIAERIPKMVRLSFSTEMLPLEENRIELSEKKDEKLQIPRPRFTFDIGDYAKGGLREGYATAIDIFNTMGATLRNPQPKPLELGNGKVNWNTAAHIMGTTIMGDDPSNSVVDRWGRAHDVPNLWIAGSSVFTSSATANPTLTLAALSLRTAAAIHRQMQSRS